ncbi:hypothetical protein BWD07_02385 [Neisseria canis]|nr:hypothetical protein BWD07_02385 [Neisseria canis]
MKLKELLIKHAIKIQIVLLCYFTIGMFYQPHKCEIQPTQTKITSSQVYQPIGTAVKTVFTGYAYPRCFGDMKHVRNPIAGWYVPAAKEVQNRSHEIYTLAIQLISGFAAANILWIICGNFILNRLNRIRK